MLLSKEEAGVVATVLKELDYWIKPEDNSGLRFTAGDRIMYVTEQSALEYTKSELEAALSRYKLAGDTAKIKAAETLIKSISKE